MYPMVPYASFAPLAQVPMPFGDYGAYPSYGYGYPYAVFGADLDPVAVSRQAWQEVHGEPASDAQARSVVAVARSEDALGRAGRSADLASDGQHVRVSIPSGGSRPLMIGEMPAPTSDPSRVFDGRSMRWMCYLVGLDEETFRSRVDAINLFPSRLSTWPGPARAAQAARELASRLKGRPRPSLAVLVGRRVARALGHDRPFFGLGGSVDLGAHHAVPCVSMPHPSGLNRWWNDQANRATGGAFLRELVVARPNNTGAT